VKAKLMQGKTKTILGMVGAFLTGNAKPGAKSISIPGQQSSLPPQKPRLLLCAPSNAAVDEIVLRLIGGIRNAQGQLYYPNIVRVGRSDNINPRVRDVTLDQLVDMKLEATVPQRLQNGEAGEQVLRTELNKVIELRNAKEAEYDRAREIGEGNIAVLHDELKELNSRKNRIGAQLDDQKAKRLARVRDAEINRRQITMAVLDEADVICCTLSGSGHDQLAKMKVNFETVIIDEAAQSIELAALIPLKYGCHRCILVGDPNQLPPTVLSQAAAKFLYEESLFVRMQRNYPRSVYLLGIQYRMSPEISRFPSKKFYDGKLIDGPSMAAVTSREWHRSQLFRPYCFFNVHGGTQESGKRGVSLMNKVEVDIAISIYERLRQEFDHVDFVGKIGIVTPYKEQLRELLRQFRQRYGDDITSSVDLNTIDGFQGQEKDIIILSCVRAAQDQGVGFLKDVRRINVALTRAKSTLLILGNKDALRGNGLWRDLIIDAEERGLLIDCGPQTFTNIGVLPHIKSNAQTMAGRRKQGTPKRKRGKSVSETNSLNPEFVVGNKTAPIVIGSDVEMRSADSLSDDSESNSGSLSSEEGEIKDVEMVDAFTEVQFISHRSPTSTTLSINPSRAADSEKSTGPPPRKLSSIAAGTKITHKKHKQLDKKDAKMVMKSISIL
jgi:senataxin